MQVGWVKMMLLSLCGQTRDAGLLGETDDVMYKCRKSLFLPQAEKLIIQR